MVIYRHKDKYSISEMCRFFDVSRSGYYDYVKRMDVPAWDLPLAEKIRECQDHSHSTYGYRRVQIWLEDILGIVSLSVKFSSVQSFSRVQLLATPGTATCQASLSTC